MKVKLRTFWSRGLVLGAAMVVAMAGVCVLFPLKGSAVGSRLRSVYAPGFTVASLWFPGGVGSVIGLAHEQLVDVLASVPGLKGKVQPV